MRGIEIPSDALVVYLDGYHTLSLSFRSFKNDRCMPGTATYPKIFFRTLFGRAARLRRNEETRQIELFIDEFDDVTRLPLALMNYHPEGADGWCLVDTLVETWFDRLYGGPHAYDGGEIEIKPIALNACSCKK